MAVMPVEADLITLLAADSIVTAPNAFTGFRGYVGRMPDTPDTVVVLKSTGGFDPDPKWRLDRPTTQVTVRGSSLGYAAAEKKMIEVKNWLLGKGQFTYNQCKYVGIWAMGDYSHIEYDSGNRPIFVLNIRITREPFGVDDHRTPLST